jgi:hippurate hydrolase
VRGWQEELYRDLHQHPELSHQEHRTARTVSDRLGQAGFDVHQVWAAPGLSAC